MKLIDKVNNPDFKDWLLANNYVDVDGIYTNYKEGIKVVIHLNGVAKAKSLHGFETEAFIKLALAISKYKRVAERD